MNDFDIRKFDEYREDNRREVKKASGGLPHSLWETYSAFANCNGGVIILGVEEKKDGSWVTTGLKKKDQRKLIKEFWDVVNNQSKVSINLLREKDVKVYEVNEDVIIVIYVPIAPREEKPVFINDDLFRGSFRRNHEGDYRCTRAQVRAMVRDQAEDTQDMKVVDDLPLSDLNQDTISGYRNMHSQIADGHPFTRLSDDEYLRSIGAAAVSKEDGKIHPTTAGLLMFGNDYDIVREYPEYFLDYQEHLDPSIRWTDRLWSTAGTWSGNVFDFFLKAYNKIATGLKIPFKMEGIFRVDDTPVHKAVREALVNCLSNADYFGVQGVVIKKTPTELILENPGYIRTGKQQMLQGGKSDPRNKVILKMFNLLDIGERAGSGVPNIFNVWADQGWPAPKIDEEENPDRTVVTLSFLEERRKKATKKSDEKKATKKSDESSIEEWRITGRTQKQLDTVLAGMNEGVWYKSSEIQKIIGLKETRTKEILHLLIASGEVEDDGSTKGRRYKKKS